MTEDLSKARRREEPWRGGGGEITIRSRLEDKEEKEETDVQQQQVAFALDISN